MAYGDQRKIPPTPRPAPAKTTTSPEAGPGVIESSLNTLRDFASGIGDLKAQRPTDAYGSPNKRMGVDSQMNDADRIINGK